VSSPSSSTVTVGRDRRTQAVLDQVAAAVAQLQIDQAIRQQITDQIFDTTHTALFRAVHTADFIERLIDVTPSLSDQQQDELRGVANDLILIARKAPQEAYERGQVLQQAARRPQRKSDALDGLIRDVQGELTALRKDLAGITRWLRSE
jgi:hypothetical protein